MAKPTKLLLSLELKHNKDTKGTYVYTMMAPNGVEAGNIYLPKMLLGPKPGDKLIIDIRQPD